MDIDRRILNFLVIIVLSFVTFMGSFFIFELPIQYELIIGVILVRLISSRFVLRDYSLSWSKASQRSFLIKSFVYSVAFLIYMPYFYNKIGFTLLFFEFIVYLFFINFFMYLYHYITNKSHRPKTKSMVIYGAGRTGIKLESEFSYSEYSVKYFVDDDAIIQNRSIDSVRVITPQKLKSLCHRGFDLLVIAIPSIEKSKIKEIYEELGGCFLEIQVIPSVHEILKNKTFVQQLKEISVEDLLARNPKDLDKGKISSFINNQIVLITGAGGSIGSEISKQCASYGAKQLILVDHSEFNLYQIEQKLQHYNVIPVLQSVVHQESLEHIFVDYAPDIVIHAAAYKHVPLVEANIHEAIQNNIIGTKNVIDLAIKHKVKKFVLISTDKAVRPTNIMGATKRVCELYAQNVSSNQTEIVAVRFGNVLGSSGSVIPKFKEQIQNNQNITVTHPEITRYFMLISEACELVLQAGAIGKGGEIFILDMGEPVKIVDLAQKMIDLSGKDYLKIEFTGLRPGEKLYEELLIEDTYCNTQYDSITIAEPTYYAIDTLKKDIDDLVTSKDQVEQLQKIVPEFNHQLNSDS